MEELELQLNKLRLRWTSAAEMLEALKSSPKVARVLRACVGDLDEAMDKNDLTITDPEKK